MLNEPLAVRLSDLRPEEEKGNVRNPDWIYFRMEGAQQTDLLLQYLSGALVSLQATLPIRVLPEDAPDDAAAVLLQIEVVKGYARWPVKVKPEGDRVMVEGGGELRWQLLVNGKQSAKGRVKETLPDLPVPVRMIRGENVQQVVTQALSHQYNETVTKLLEEMLWQLPDHWPEQ